MKFKVTICLTAFKTVEVEAENALEAMSSPNFNEIAEDGSVAQTVSSCEPIGCSDENGNYTEYYE